MNEVTIFTLYIGHNRENSYALPTQEVYDTCEEAFADYGIPGVTYTHGRGSWEGETEQCTIVTILGDSDGLKVVATAAKHIAKALSQKKILLSVTTGLAGMVDAEA